MASKLAVQGLGQIDHVEIEFGSHDISSLDPGSDDANVSEWGGLTGFSGRFGRAIAEAANEAPV